MNSTEQALMQVRDQLQLNTVAQVRITFEPDFDRIEQGLCARLLCMNCNEEFSWLPDARWWVCPVCGIELTPEEAEVFLRVVRQSLKTLNSDVGNKRGGRWFQRLLRLFRRAR